MSERYDDAEYVPSVTTTEISMSERETPRTDAAAMEACGNCDDDENGQAMVSIRFARDLERENARLKAKLAAAERKDVDNAVEFRRVVNEINSAKDRAEQALARILRDNGLNSDNAALAREAHTDHPLRVWDRTCPACQEK
jgi:hypothetical protein